MFVALESLNAYFQNKNILFWFVCTIVNFFMIHFLTVDYNFYQNEIKTLKIKKVIRILNLIANFGTLLLPEFSIISI